ncbi:MULTISPECIES: GntR family transcriptional regulator [Croceitalea]|uniref:GntR family transcriptional regulator n=1 Tax=Croceitalea vernalis TaxID=3075599 RepID=A0ABU3BH92_9FLAO|nr:MULTISPECIES: GntR family transcriptional regulator [unclassified Croceitalea]MDT0539708.1 GntR family transcriptional regulator [Croceitalea sp. P059]MDT0621522.1 GntR family transcriptional regulator [Croceitalea sp. P007]
MNSTNILRNKVRKHLLKKILKGELIIGKTLNLAQLSRELNISVTPIREALSQLEQARIIRAIPNRGFIIPELSYEEARDIYNTIAQLEVIAVENSDFKKSTIHGLREEQLHLQQTHTPEARLNSRISFHHLLVQDCENKILLAILEDLEARVLFYEQLFITDSSFYEQIDNQNESIIAAIEEDNVPTAALILKMNWMNIFEHIRHKLILKKTVHHTVIE